jgi:hypothetical protein
MKKTEERQARLRAEKVARAVKEHVAAQRRTYRLKNLKNALKSARARVVKLKAELKVSQGLTEGERGRCEIYLRDIDQLRRIVTDLRYIKPPTKPPASPAATTTQAESIDERENEQNAPRMET